MIKLIDLLKEVENDPTKNLSDEDLKKYQAALDLLQKQGDALEEGLKDSLKKLGLSAAVIAALMATPSLTKAQKAVVKDQTPTVQSKATQTYSGNPEMDHIKFSNQVLQKYKSINPGFWVEDGDDIKEVQKAMKIYRSWALEQWKKGKLIIKSSDLDYANLDDAGREDVKQQFMSATTKTDVDGLNGQYTSQFIFPGGFIKDLETMNVRNLGIEGNQAMMDIAKSLNMSKKQMEDWNNYVNWMKRPTL